MSESEEKNMKATIERINMRIAEREARVSGFYTFTFSYGTSRSALRYIPVHEGHKCYFEVCGDEKCPALKYHPLHPVGFRKCSSGFRPCNKAECHVKVRHLKGTHKRCLDCPFPRPVVLPEIASKYIVATIPEGEMVYHFSKEDFPTFSR